MQGYFDRIIEFLKDEWLCMQHNINVLASLFFGRFMIWLLFFHNLNKMKAWSCIGLLVLVGCQEKSIVPITAQNGIEGDNNIVDGQYNMVKGN